MRTRSNNSKRPRHIAIATSLLALYLLSYYGWLRHWEGTHKGQGMYSLHYDQVPSRPLRNLLELIHAPLHSFDQSHYAMLIDTRGPDLLIEVPEFDDPPISPSTTNSPSPAVPHNPGDVAHSGPPVRTSPKRENPRRPP